MASGKMRKRTQGDNPPPLLYIAQILEWADEHLARTGQWPTHESGRIPGTLHEK